MDPRLKKTIVGASLFAFGTHTFDLTHEGIIGHELPSALQLATAPVMTGSTVSVMMVFTSFGNASTEAVYPSVADSQVLKHDAETVPTPPNGGPKRP
jgi:hypothetical protein